MDGHAPAPAEVERCESSVARSPSFITLEQHWRRERREPGVAAHRPQPPHTDARVRATQPRPFVALPQSRKPLEADPDYEGSDSDSEAELQLDDGGGEAAAEQVEEEEEADEDGGTSLEVRARARTASRGS